VIDRFREVTSAKGKRQFNFNLGGGEPFMMLPADMALWWDAAFRGHVQYYDRHRLEFRSDARVNFQRLTELGCAHLAPEKPCAPARDRYL
jgi:hypothetical protein